jgi:hypothetical protein
MGAIIGTFTLILGLFCTLFPKYISWHSYAGIGEDRSYYVFENGKFKKKYNRLLVEIFGENKSIFIVRLIGVGLIIGSIFIFLSSSP